jgi:MFS superfamily sulfate permease-like transporter
VCAEYGLLLATFGAIMQWGLEGGIAAGVVFSTVYFALAYARSQVAAIDVMDGARSSVVRTVEQQARSAAAAGLAGCRAGRRGAWAEWGGVRVRWHPAANVVMGASQGVHA